MGQLSIYCRTKKNFDSEQKNIDKCSAPYLKVTHFIKFIKLKITILT